MALLDSAGESFGVTDVNESARPWWCEALPLSGPGSDFLLGQSGRSRHPTAQ